MRPIPGPMALVMLAAATLVVGVAALALPRAASSQSSSLQNDAPARGLLVLSDDERRRASPQWRPRRDPGPFHPVVGAVDYGSGGAGFGAARSGHVHAGQDVFAPAGTPLVAVDDATVVEAGSDGGRGNHVALYDARRKQTYAYFHMSAPAPVKPGQRVKAGTRVGAVGCTGSCWGDHLHFEVRAGRDPYGRATDPRPMLEKWRALKRPR